MVSLRALLLCFNFLWFNGSDAQAAQEAVVVAKKAIIYADSDLQVPIGFVLKGKKISVGDIKKKNGGLLPVISHGKIAWIEVKNLALKEDLESRVFQKRLKEHDLGDYEEQKGDDPLDENNYISLGLSQMVGIGLNGEQGNDRNTFFNDELSSSEISLLFEHRNPFRNWHFGLDVSFLQMKGDLAEYKSVIVRPLVNYVFMNWSYFTVEAGLGASFSGDFRVVSQGIGQYKGSLFGYSFGAKARLFPYHTWSAYLGMGYEYMNLINLNDVESTQTNDVAQFDSLTNFKIVLGLTYQL